MFSRITTANVSGVQRAPVGPQAAQVQPGAAQEDEPVRQPVPVQPQVFPLWQGFRQTLPADAPRTDPHWGETLPLPRVQQSELTRMAP